MKRYICELEVLTAIHIGTGEELSPLDYYIASDISNSGKSKFIRFSIDQIISSLTKEERSRLLDIIDKDNYLHLHNFFKDDNRALKCDAIKYEAEISSELEREYSEYLRRGRNGNSFLQNQMLISETKHVPGSMVPYIPGSSIKGAIRTAVLDYLLVESNSGIKNEIGRIRNSKELEARILKAENSNGRFNIDRDPFRTLQVSDCIMPNSNSIYVGKMNTKMSIRSEVIAGRFMGKTNKSRFFINVKIELEEVVSKIVIDRFKSINNLIGDINDFSFEILKFEKEQFYSNGNNYYFEKLIDEYGKIDPQKNECLIRIGRYSQQQGVTLSPFHEKQTGKTRTLLNTDSGMVPMGWCKLIFRET